MPAHLLSSKILADIRVIITFSNPYSRSNILRVQNGITISVIHGLTPVMIHEGIERIFTKSSRSIYYDTGVLITIIVLSAGTDRCTILRNPSMPNLT